MKYSLLLIILSIFLFISCEKDFSGVVDYQLNQFQVTSVSPSGNITYNALDSVITVKIEFTASSRVGEVSFDIYSSENIKINVQRVTLLDNGNAANGDEIPNDNKFANRFPLSTFYPIGTYSIRFFTSDIKSGERMIAQSTFNYDNGQNNLAPVISGLVMIDSATTLPVDSVNVDQSFIFSVQVDDDNGYSDISLVYFELFRPDGSVVSDGSGNSKIQMFDTGNFAVYGDQTAGDGIFSFKNKFLDDPSTQRGNWTFEFQAIDRGGLLSNKITKILKVL